MGNKTLDASLASVGYSRVPTNMLEWASIRRPSVYIAAGDSGEVEHFLYVGGGIKRHRYLASRFGFRSDFVEDFSISTLIKYGHPNFKLWSDHHDRQIGCALSFDLSFASKPIPEPLLLGSEGAIEYVTTTAHQRLLPIVRRASSLSGFFQLLTTDSEPCPWLANFGLVRAAQVVGLGLLLDFPREAIRDFLVPHFHLICRHVLNRSITSSVDGCVDQLVDDWKRRNK